MEEKQNVSHQSGLKLNNQNPDLQLKKPKRVPTTRRIIRKKKKVKRSGKGAKTHKKLKKRKAEKQMGSGQPSKEAEICQKNNQNQKAEENQPKIEAAIENPGLQLIEFDLSILPQRIQKLYQSKEKLKNTDLMVPGVKFLIDPTLISLKKWSKAIIVYQRTYKTKKHQRFHFGLVLKFEQRLITFDGVPKLWPIDQMEKSYHWVPQQDTWSCGYRVLFWLRKITNVGIEQWIEKYEFSPEKEEEKQVGV